MKPSRRTAEVLEPLVLASASPRRERILTDLGHAFTVRPADVDETPPPGVAAEEVARTLAERKARAVAALVLRGTVIGADTIVVGADGRLLGKPADAADAHAMLASLSGTTHRVVTGVALVNRPGGVLRSGRAVTAVTMRALADDEIAAYVATGEPFGKAGAYAIQERADRFVTGLDGDYDNVVGFPSRLFERLLEQLAAALQGGE